jgi:Spy/CpxP family protein refolding chaperone
MPAGSRFRDEDIAMSAPDTRGSTARGRGALLIGVVFLAGALAGAAADRAWVARHIGLVGGEGQGRLSRNSPLAERRLLSTIPDQFTRLHLTPHQDSVLSAIARRRRPRADSVMQALRPTVQHLETEMMQEMLCALTPAQQADWLAYMQANRWNPDVVAERYKLVETHTCPSTP